MRLESSIFLTLLCLVNSALGHIAPRADSPDDALQKREILVEPRNGPLTAVPTEILTTLHFPSPTTFTTDGTRLIIKVAPTSVVLQVKATPAATQASSDGVATYEQVCFPSTNPDCCYIGNNNTVSPCLWDAADIPTFLETLPQPSNGDWVTSLATQYGGAGQNPMCTLATGCNFSIQGASGDDMTAVKAVIALIAAQNWFTYEYVNYQMVSNAMGDFISGELQNIYNQLYETKHQTPAWETVKDGLAIVAGIVAVCAAPLTSGSSAAVAAAILIKSLGVTSNIGNFVESLRPVTGVLGTYQGTHNYFADLQSSWTDGMAVVAAAFTANATYASGILSDAEGLSGGWVDIPQDVQNSWLNINQVKGEFTAMLTAYAASRIWQSNGLFLHWESECLTSATNNKYPAQQCITHSDSMMSVNNNCVFPVLFVSDLGADHEVNTVRRYDSANNWPGISRDPDWSNVYIGSYKCQFHYQGTSGFPSSPYPGADIDLSSLVLGSISAVDIPCLFNLPLCSSGDATTVSQCQNSYGRGACCINHSGHDHSTLEGWAFDNSQKSDNFGLDNFCSGQLHGGYFQPEDVGLTSCK